MGLYARKSDKKEFVVVVGGITIQKGNKQNEIYIYRKFKKDSSLARKRICDTKTFLKEYEAI